MRNLNGRKQAVNLRIRSGFEAASTSESKTLGTWVSLNLNYSNRSGFGPHRMAILESVEKFGSIAAAAESVGWTYRKTWSIVRRMNVSLGEVVVTNRGRQGGARLTLRGKKILKRYRELERKVYEIFADDLRFLEDCVGDDPKAAPYIPRWARVEEPKCHRAMSPSSK